MKALTRSEGTRAMRLSVRVSRVPENTLLKPRTTALLRATPIFAKSTPGRSLMKFKLPTGYCPQVRQIPSHRSTS